MNQSDQTLISASEASILLSVTYRAVTKACFEGRLNFDTVTVDGVDQYRIHLSSLTTEAQAKYWIQRHSDTFPPGTDRQSRCTWLMALKLDFEVHKLVYKAVGLHIDPLSWSDEESEKRHAELFKMKTFAKETARERARLVRGYVLARRNAPENQTEAGRDYASLVGVSLSTLAAWHKRVKGLQQKDWDAALVPGWHGGRKKEDIHPEVLNFLQCQYLVASQPTAKSVYQRASRLAADRGWPMPSYRVALARLQGIDRPLRVLQRDGKTALANMFPGIIRDYSTLPLNFSWCSDGRKSDVFVIDDDGVIFRPMIVSWIEQRSRVVLGYHVGKGESIEEVRLSFLNAVQRFNCLPEEAYLDNGSAFTGKQFVGGQTMPKRYKIKKTDIYGILTVTGVRAVIANPYHGQSKSIESQHNTHARATDRRAEFVKAYCGKDTLSRPEGSNPKDHPIPLAQYMAAFSEETEAYNTRAHRGVGMEGKSPMQVYTELQAVSVARTPTKEQMTWCMLVSQSVTLSKKDSSFVINGNVYWHEDLPKLESTGPYTARYDGNDSKVPVQLFDGETCVCDGAELRLAIGARNLAAAKDGIRAKNAQTRAVKDLAKAIKAEQKARRWDVATKPDAPGAGAALVAEAAKVVTPMRPTKNYKPVKPTPSGGVNGNPWLTPEMEATRERKLAAMGGRY